MKIPDKTLELAYSWLTRPATGRTGRLLVATGCLLLSPPLLVPLLNQLFEQYLNHPISPMEALTGTGWALIGLGTLLVLLGQFGSKSLKDKEVIGIRHNSLGHFNEEAIKPYLPLLQRLQRYREIDVDHSDSYHNGVLSDHNTLIRRLDKVPVELGGLTTSGNDTPIAYYGLPHIPAAFYLGYLLSDSKYNIQLFDLNNKSKRWDQLSGVSSAIPIRNSKEALRPSLESGDIVLSIGISYPIQQTEIDELGIQQLLGHVAINAEQPRRQLLTSEEQIESICREFRATLEHIKNTCPNRRRIHLFYSGPVSLCFALGRCISERIDSSIEVYNYSAKESPRYKWSLTLNSPTASSATFTQHSAQGDSHAPVQHAQ